MTYVLKELKAESTECSTKLEIVLRKSNSLLIITAESTQRGNAWAFASCLSGLIGTDVEAHVTKTQVSIGECLLPGDALSELTTLEEVRSTGFLTRRENRIISETWER